MDKRNDIITPISKKDERLRLDIHSNSPRNYLAYPLEYGPADCWRLATRLKLKKKFFNHIPALQAKQNLPARIWNNYIIISVERHPFDRAISSYFWRTRKIANPVSLNEYIKYAPAKELSNWSIYSIEDNVIADFMIRYEHLQDDLSKLSKLLKLPRDIELPPLKAKSDHRHDKRPWQELLNSSSLQRLRLSCAKEAIYFNYNLNKID